MKLDARDKRLLYLLDMDSRAKESELAKLLHTSKQVVSYRVRKLLNDGVIKKFQAVPSFNALGMTVYANIYFKIHLTTEEEYDSIITYLINHPKIGYVGALGGRFDVSIVLTAKNTQELDNLLSSIIVKFPLALREYMISQRIIGSKFHRKYLSGEKTLHEKKVLSKSITPASIDELDKSILTEVSSNSRDSLVKISERLKIPFSTLRMRLKQLEVRGIISGYSILMDVSKIGMHNYKLLIRVKDKTQLATQKLFEYAKQHNNITWFFKTIGEYDFELRIEVESQEHYQEIIRELRTKFFDIIDETESVIVFKELKEDYSTLF